MKKIISILLVLTLTFAPGLMAECSSNNDDPAGDQNDPSGQNVEISQNSSNDDNSDDTQQGDESDNTTFTIEYPADMQALGYTEPLVLDRKPVRVVCLSAAPVLALYELGVNMVGIPNSMVVTWPEDLANSTERVSFSVMSPDDFDYEAVVALEPDLVLLAANGADTAGATLEGLGINVYYLNAGHTVSYDSVKMQTEALIRAFSTDDESTAAGEAIMERFAELEANIESAKNAFAGNTVMVLQSGDAQTHYIQTKDGTLGSMLDMIGFTNVYENATTSMAQLDFEQALDYQPDYLVCVGATDAATHQALMDEAFADNPEYWNAIPAVANGNVICLDVTYGIAFEYSLSTIQRDYTNMQMHDCVIPQILERKAYEQKSY